MLASPARLDHARRSTYLSRMALPSPEPPLFQALITPHRSLEPRGFVLLLTALACLSFAAGLGFFLIGAWPVVGFLGLDVLLVWLAFRLNYRHARQFERLRLSRDSLTVERQDYYGARRHWTFQPAWLRVELERPPEHDSALYLASHGRRFAIGGFLSAEEKLALAEALDAGLMQARRAPGL
jgi:uncharacterized membrane protein